MPNKPIIFNLVSHFLLLSSHKVVGNEHSINFWLDTWHNNYPLSIQFLLVYAKARSSLVSLSVVWNMDNIKLNLTHSANLTMC
jgi:hypothetical protein